jgi:holo-[acyl-carrier protein] synthase
MIIGIGCDIVEHQLTKQLNWEADMELLKGSFSPGELELYHTKKTTRFLSGRFAAKEAVLKCLGTGMHDGISLASIEILQNEIGKPEVKLSGEVKRISNKLGINLWHVSITHSTGHSMAFVVAEKQKSSSES